MQPLAGFYLVMNAKRFDWHSDLIARTTPVDATYRNTQNVRRFLKSQCGPAFRFDRAFMLWIKGGADKTMGDVADEWLRRQISNRDSLGRGGTLRRRCAAGMIRAPVGA
jgi:Domain of unknown function (DUF6434)